MSQKLKEKERLARRDLERFRRRLHGGALGIAELLLLQRAHESLFEVEVERTNGLLNSPLADAVKPEAARPGGFVEIALPRPRLHVYHGTVEAAAAKILKEGIVPRGERPANHPEVPSHPGCVYLTDAFAMSYIMSNQHSEPGQRGAVLEIELEPLMANLLPDEDALGPRGDFRGQIENMAQGEVGFFTNVLLRSLYFHGSVAHRGTVPLSAIRRVAYIPRMWAGWLAVETWRDTRVLGAMRVQQQKILAWVFDGGDGPFPIPAEELVFNSHLATELASMAAWSEEQADALLAAGVKADTLWRLRLMEHPEMFTREGIEVVAVGGGPDK